MIEYTKIQNQKEMISFELKHIKRRKTDDSMISKYKYLVDIVLDGKLRNTQIGIYADNIEDLIKEAKDRIL